MAHRELHLFSAVPSDAAVTNPAKPNPDALYYIHIQSLDARRHIPALAPPKLPSRLDP